MTPNPSTHLDDLMTTTPAALYGTQTRLAMDNFPTGGRTLADVPAFLRAYAMVKAAAACANVELGVLDPAYGRAIERAAREVADGAHPAQFPTALVQGGGGTSTNMNVNEVLAARATQLLGADADGSGVHPNDHVNRSQSTNDSYPTAMAMALHELAHSAAHSLELLEHTFLVKAKEYDDLPRLGRTCLQDAVPLTVGQTHRAHAGALRRHRTDLMAAARALTAVPLGATAVGTGVGAPEGYASLAVEHLSRLTGQEYTVAEDFFDDLAHLDPYLTLAGAIARPAITMAKIAADLRLLSSGPTGGLHEVVLPERQAGSSIMPGKVNPVIPELVMQLSYRVRGAAHTVEMAVAAGELELNIMEPVILDSLISAYADLVDASTTFAEKCVADLRWDVDALRHNLRGSREALVQDAIRNGHEHAEHVAEGSTD